VYGAGGAGANGGAGGSVYAGGLVGYTTGVIEAVSYAKTTLVITGGSGANGGAGLSAGANTGAAGSVPGAGGASGVVYAGGLLGYSTSDVISSYASYDAGSGTGNITVTGGTPGNGPNASTLIR
jgi:hypothetical protein